MLTRESIKQAQKTTKAAIHYYDLVPGAGVVGGGVAVV
jgi:hypothetical protein